MKRPDPRRIDFDTAERIGIAGLGFLADDPARLGLFLATTGLGPAELRAEAGSPGMLGAVLEYLLGDETQLLAFTANAGINPEQIQPAWDMLVLEAARRSRR